MTPKREKYLAKCSEIEKRLRVLIKEERGYLRLCKAMLNPQYAIPDTEHYRKEIKITKFYLSMYRHELARLKGMDRVVVPRDVHITYLGFGKVGKCTCGGWVTPHEIYCPNCGRRILWDEVE